MVVSSSSPPLDLASLAQARLATNAGRYQVVIFRDDAPGKLAGLVARVREDQDGFYCIAARPELRLLETRVRHDSVLIERAENAGFHRDNTLDIYEELADALNISGLLLQRLERDGRMTDELAKLFVDCSVYLSALADTVSEIRDRLPDHYRQDAYPVQRDPVGMTA